MTIRRRTALLLVAACVALAGCAGESVTQYAGQRPVLDLRQYFNGQVRAHGMFQDRSGHVVKRFTVTMDCAWTGDDGVLDEHFTYADGTLQRRVWHLKRHPDGRYTGSAADVVGQASGRISGNAFNWTYTLKLPVGGSVYDVDLDDWMYLMDDGVMLNRATMSKLGIRLGEITLAFTRIP